MKQIVTAVCIGICFFVAFYIFSLEVKREQFTKINFDVTVKLQDNISPKLDEPFEDLSFLVSPVLSLVLLAIITFIALIDVKKKKIYPGALFIPLFFVFMIGLELLGKAKVESPGPPFFMLKNPTTIFPIHFVQEAFSYPSGHAARALYLFGIFCILVFRLGNKKIFGISTIVMMGIILLISLGKVYLGHHWLSDIIGGWIIASAFLILLIPLLHTGIKMQTIFSVTKK